jgi:hypothetical protein
LNLSYQGTILAYAIEDLKIWSGLTLPSLTLFRPVALSLVGTFQLVHRDLSSPMSMLMCITTSTSITTIAAPKRFSDLFKLLFQSLTSLSPI